MIKLSETYICDSCGKLIKERYGEIFFQSKYLIYRSKKIDLCKKCYKKVCSQIDSILAKEKKKR